MRVLLLNQCFYPDVVATAQHLTDLALELNSRGHSVTVIAGNRGYDGPTSRFASREHWNGIDILRIPALQLGKKSRWRRALNFGSFLFVLALRLLVIGRFDAVVALTSPPLISYMAALFIRLRGGKLIFWVMDLNPDEAIAAGWLRAGSVTARVLERMLHYSMRHSTTIVALDRFMKQRLVDKGISSERVQVVPPWSFDDNVSYSRQGREEFRTRYAFSDKFLVMYAGNHSPCHPLDTLLGAALQLKDNNTIVFCFVGGGSELTKVREFAAQHALTNISCLPYQPLSELSGTLSAADLHVVVLGDKFAGIVHPCKIYNILTVGASTLYIGPAASHVIDIAANSPEKFFLHRHGDIDGVTSSILKESELPQLRSTISADHYLRHQLLPQITALIEAEPLEVHAHVCVAEVAQSQSTQS